MQIRFILHPTDPQDGGEALIDWPDCGWEQAWRLVHLFSRMEGPGHSYIYVT